MQIQLLIPIVGNVPQTARAGKVVSRKKKYFQKRRGIAINLPGQTQEDEQR